MKNKLLDTLKWLFGFRTLTVIIIGMSVPFLATAQEEEEEELEGFTITGSRIKRLDVETVNPVLSLSQEDLESTGFTTVSDTLRALPFNSGQALTPEDAGTSFTPGISTVNLRGLGNNNTLVLVNGRRTAPYASPGFNGLQTMFDMNSIPVGAIEAIEILKDGASAIYGSDAVSGVINVKLRTDYQGVNTKVDFGNFIGEDAIHYGASFVVGDATAKTSFIAAVNYSFDSEILAKTLAFSADADHSKTIAIEANAHWVHDDPAAIDADIQATNPGLDLDWWENAFLEAAPLWFDLRSSRGYPGYLIVPGYGRVTLPEPVGYPAAIDDFVGGYNPYNYQETSGFLSEVKAWSFYGRVKHDFSDFLYGFMEFSYSRVDSFSRSAGTPVDIETSRGLHEGEDMYYPASNPFNPFGVDVYSGRRRMWEQGNRTSDIKSDTPRIVVGLGGELESGWSWETGLLYVTNTVSDTSYVAVDYRLQQAMLGLGTNADGSMFWDADLPADERTYYNWFGETSDNMMDFITTLNPNEASVKLTQIDASISGSAFELPAGSIGFAAGFEARHEALDNLRSDLNATTMILGGSEGTGFQGERDVESIHVEVNIPLLKELELQLAGRWEQYSDEGFASDIRPKVALKFQPTDWIVFRGSYNESFKAPDLAYLYTASSTSFSAFQFTDPVTFNEIDQIQIKTEGNRSLGPETTESVYYGVVLEPGGKLEGLTFSVDYFNLEQTDLLAQLSDFYGYTDFFTFAAEGNPLFADKVVRGSDGEVLFIRDVYENISKAEYTGYDTRIGYRLETENWGQFDTELSLTYLDEYTIDGDDISNTRLFPNVRANLFAGWSRGDWSASVFVNYIKGRDVDYWAGDPSDYGVSTNSHTSTLVYTVDDQYVINPRVSYEGFMDTRLTFGINNLGSDSPPADPQETSGGTAGVNYVKPAFWYMSVEREF